MFVHGEIPEGMQIDHINGDACDNRISNLRLANQKQQRENQRRYKSNKSGHRGVSWDSERRMWQAKVGHNGKQINLGRYAALEDAVAAAKAARQKLFTHDHGRDAA